MEKYEKYIEKGLVPDFMLRRISRLTCKVVTRKKQANVADRTEKLFHMVSKLSQMPLAIEVDAANLQHYEVPTEFFKKVLGKRLKYSCCMFPENVRVKDAHQYLDDAEERMLALTCEHADLKPGQKVLELGCGWGSLSLFMAEKFPKSQFTSISNSRTQKIYIDGQAKAKGLTNLTVITNDMNTFSPEEKFDRVVSVEMFEHMRNYKILFERVRKFLKPGGKLFFHIFTYSGTPYLFNADNPNDWMGRHFFAGGTMPSVDLPFYFNEGFSTERVWTINGKHYQLTLEAWLQKMDQQKNEIFPLFVKEYGADAKKFWNNWRLFFIACAEVFGFSRGNEWFVTHYLMKA